MKKYLKIYTQKLCVLFFISLVSCSSNKENKQLEITVKNQLNFDRAEIVEIDRNFLEKILKDNPEENIRIKQDEKNEYIVNQWIDYDGDGINEKLLFLAKVSKKTTSKYRIVVDTMKKPRANKIVSYGRFVPERTDDFTWENDRVAFRTYGPDAQRRIEQQEDDGTLSSGIDLWLKRVEYSIIDKWYSKNINAPGYYHIDKGEGHDPYDVGSSRGTGGIGVWENDSLYVSKNFTNHKVIASGPLRTVFELSYAPWSSYEISETKRITLDLGSNFSKFEIALQAKNKVPNYTVGITLHDNQGEVKINKEQGWFRHWEPMANSYVGEGIIMPVDNIIDAKAHHSKKTDQSQLLVISKPMSILTYYAGFAWTKSNQVTTVKDWDELLQKQTQIINNKMIVTVNK